MKLQKLSHYAMKIYVQSQPHPKQLVSFDLGTKHTGCAISCMNIKKPYFLKSIKITNKSSTDDFNDYYRKLEKQMLKIFHQNKPTAVIFGIPEKYSEEEYYQHKQIVSFLSYFQAMRTLIEGFLQKYNFQSSSDSNQKQLEKNSQPEKMLIKYTLVDEAWSTKQAMSKLKDIQQAYSQWGHLHKQKQLLDGMAAMKILERYLTYYNS